MMIRCVTVAALGLTALLIAGVASHLTGQDEARAAHPQTSVDVDDPSRVGRGFKHETVEAARTRTARERDEDGDGAFASERDGETTLGETPPGAEPAVYRVEIVNKFPHDPTAFTQGLLFRSPDTLFESTGSVGGPSTVREVDLTTGAVRNKADLHPAHFAEGLTMYKGQLAQITWRSNRGFYYDPKTLTRTGEFRTPLKDGWGLTNDARGDLMIVTDASDQMHFIDPSGGEDLTLARSTTVTDGGKALRFINELETIGGQVWGNVLERDCVARIDPRTGRVVGWVIMDGLRHAQDPGTGNAGVLNGIAYDTENDRLFVTGKNWANVFEVRVIATDTSVDEARRRCQPADALPHYGYP